MMLSLYKAVHSSRHFAPNVRFSEVNWNSLTSVVDAFDQRIRGWYISPAKQLAKEWNFAFSVLAIDCLLIDMLSQLHNSKSKNVGDRFREYTKTYFLGFGTKISPPIEVEDENGKMIRLDDVADVFYQGVRNGIIHQAQCSLYTQVEQLTTKIFSIHPSGLTICRSTSQPCVCVTFDPVVLLQKVETRFKEHIANLKNSSGSNNPIREQFKHFIDLRFGESIPATL